MRVRQAVRGCVLEHGTCDADAAARGVFDGLAGLAVEGVVIQAATGRSHGGEVGMIRPPGRRTRRTIEGSIAWMRMWKVRRKQGERRRGQKRDVLAY